MAGAPPVGGTGDDAVGRSVLVVARSFWLVDSQDALWSVNPDVVWSAIALEVEPKAGIEPATRALRMRCSTSELLRLEFVRNLGGHHSGGCRVVIRFLWVGPYFSPRWGCRDVLLSRPGAELPCKWWAHRLKARLYLTEKGGGMEYCGFITGVASRRPIVASGVAARRGGMPSMST